MSKIKSYCVGAPVTISFFVANYQTIRAALIACAVVLLIVAIVLFMDINNKKPAKKPNYLKWIILMLFLINLMAIVAYQQNYADRYELWRSRDSRNQMMDGAEPNCG